MPILSPKLKSFVLTMAALFALPLLVFLTMLIATSGRYEVPKTVTDDLSVPQLVLNQITFHAETFGNPEHPPLLVLHDGPGGDYRNLLALKALADSHYLIFFDQRGSGLSARVPAAQLTIEDGLKDVESFIAHYAGERPIRLLGHGWGGMLATAYAGRHPERVERLVLAEPGFLNTEMANQALPLMNQTSAGFIYNTSISWVRSLHVKGPDSDAGRDFVFARIRQHPAFHCGQRIPDDAPDRVWRAGFGAWKILTQSTFDERGHIKLDFTEGLKRLKQPVLLLASECNTLTGKAFQTRQSRLFPQAGVTIIPKSGHEMFVDNPQASLAAVSAYLKTGQAVSP